MQNYVQEGEHLTITAAASALSGDPVVLTDRVCIAEHDVASGEDLTVLTEGVVELAKNATQAFTVGEKLYWDVGDKNLTSNSETSANKPIGWSANAYASAETSAAVILGAW